MGERDSHPIGESFKRTVSSQKERRVVSNSLGRMMCSMLLFFIMVIFFFFSLPRELCDCCCSIMIYKACWDVQCLCANAKSSLRHFFLSYTVGIDYINVYSIVMVLTPIFSYVNLCIVESLFRCIMKY